MTSSPSCHSGAEPSGSPLSELRVGLHFFAQKLGSVSRELGEAECTQRRITGGRHSLPDMADIFDFVDVRARTLDHVDTQIRLGGQQNSAAVVRKSDHTSATRSAHTSGQNQPSETSTPSSTIDACYTQGYDHGYNMGARKNLAAKGNLRLIRGRHSLGRTADS